MTYVLGLNAYHADAFLVKDGDLVAAVEEERFRRIKHWGGFPSESIGYCLGEDGISLAEVSHVAVNSDNSANRWRNLAHVLIAGISPRYVLKRLRHRGDRADVARNLQRTLPDKKFTGTVHAVEHHLCHLASAFLVSPYDKVVAVSVDGFGDFSSAAWGLGEGGKLAVEGRVYFPHSLGVFYEAMTQFVGFPRNGDEYKVMGFAPHGQPTLVDIPSGGRLWSDALLELLGPPRDAAAPLEDHHRDIARSAQVTVLAGGCAYNSVANGKILERTPFKRVYVQSASGDTSGAIGAAFETWHEVEGDRAKRRFVMDHAYWGPQATPE